MMCYKDRTWCSHSFMCENSSCDRRLNGEELRQAVEWWGGIDFPASYTDFKTDDCGYSQIDAPRDENVESTDA